MRDTCAAEAYEHVVELSPRSDEIWQALAVTYSALGRLAEGVTAAQKSLELAPNGENSRNSHQILAFLYDRSGQPEEALAYAQTAWELAPDEQKSELLDLVEQLQQVPD